MAPLNGLSDVEAAHNGVNGVDEAKSGSSLTSAFVDTRTGEPIDVEAVRLLLHAVHAPGIVCCTMLRVVSRVLAQMRAHCALPLSVRRWYVHVAVTAWHIQIIGIQTCCQSAAIASAGIPGHA